MYYTCVVVSLPSQVLEYNVPFGKKNRGMFVSMAYTHLVASPAEDDLRTARILGWCIELVSHTMINKFTLKVCNYC